MAITFVDKFKRAPLAQAWQWDGSQAMLDDVKTLVEQTSGSDYAAEITYSIDANGALTVDTPDGTYVIPQNAWITFMVRPPNTISLPPFDYIYATAADMATDFGDVANRP